MFNFYIYIYNVLYIHIHTCKYINNISYVLGGLMRNVLSAERQRGLSHFLLQLLSIKLHTETQTHTHRDRHTHTETHTITHTQTHTRDTETDTHTQRHTQRQTHTDTDTHTHTHVTFHPVAMATVGSCLPLTHCVEQLFSCLSHTHTHGQPCLLLASKHLFT